MFNETSSSLRVWEYHDTSVAFPPVSTGSEALASRAAAGFTEAQVEARIEAALAEAEARWANELATAESRRKAQLEAALEGFTEQRARYFRNAESEVVHLALAIAKKILGREARQDPDLLAALVRIALDRMGAGPAVRLRLPVSDLPRWQADTEFAKTRFECELVADPSLGQGECMVETSLGRANFGFDAQLKEIEQGMLALVELRPDDRTDDHPTDRPNGRTETEPAASAKATPRSSVQVPMKAA